MSKSIALFTKVSFTTVVLLSAVLLANNALSSANAQDLQIQIPPETSVNNRQPVADSQNTLQTEQALSPNSKADSAVKAPLRLASNVPSTIASVTANEAEPTALKSHSQASELQYSDSPDDPPLVHYQQGELEQLLAPIALYPDSLLSHILIASTYPIEIVEASRWLANNTGLSASDVIARAENKDWDPSIKALLPFPAVVNKMSNELTWTQQIGDAFLEAQAQVLESIQTLRQQADEAGNLTKMENMKVTRVEKVIVIEPAKPEIIYVPYYDSRRVYGSWHWHYYPPIYWPEYAHFYPHHYGHNHSPYYWNSGVEVAIGFFFGRVSWRNHYVIVNHHSHHYRHHYGRYHKNKVHVSRGKQRHAKNHFVKAERWQHQPKHRKGVAYKSAHIAKRFNSQRPTQNTERLLRQQQKDKAINRHPGQFKSRDNDFDQRALNKSTVLANKLKGNRLERKESKRQHAIKSKEQTRQQPLVSKIKAERRELKRQPLNKSNSLATGKNITAVKKDVTKGQTQRLKRSYDNQGQINHRKSLRQKRETKKVKQKAP
ncbi:DUF3300 domain-containing protein [Thalassotalea aquiviva]|uniref:DUF3300 domain-containing protein n=1 Tax=Thalassotalea aquiviva TaxID=3242415 RepID=UPI00352AFBC9